MKLRAKNAIELDLCLKFLYAEGLKSFPIDMGETENGKLYFDVVFSVDEQKYEEIKSKYELLIEQVVVCPDCDEIYDGAESSCCPNCNF